ncbi:MAG TPA: glycogen synthase, partial [Geobacteraceae bacterium]|nr:glycogen synthase [Geobacteraceae bacterium]
SVPVVRKTGGLADTVFDSRDGVRDPNGFSFDDYTPEAFLEAITRALDAYRDKKSWDKMVRIGMHSDYSWEHSAAEYDALYEKALTKVVY